MAKYGNQYVDEQYRSAIEPNLYTDEVLIPGVTFSEDIVEGPSGGYYAHKLSDGAEVEPGTPGRDFSDEAAKDDLIQVSYNNNFQKSRKIYGVQAAAVKFDMGEAYLANSLNVTKQGRRYSALACMVCEGTVLTDKTATTDSNVVEKITSIRKAVKDNHGQANFLLVSTSVFAVALQALGLKTTDDPAIVSAQLVKRFGLNIIECNSFDKVSAKYYDYSGTLRTVDLTDVEMICGYHESFKLEDNFAVYRLVDSENFAGSKAQVEFNTAMRVVNSKQIVIKKKQVTKYTVTYNAGGGTGSIAPVTVVEGNSIELSDGTGLTGPTGKLVFKGWAKTNNASAPDVTSPYTPTANTTLYAVWSAT